MTRWAGLPGGPVVTCGEPIVAIVPTEPVPFHAASSLRTCVGGAELNVAIGVARLGQPATFVGRVGADSLGRLVLDELVLENVDALHVHVDPERRTGLYLREWLPGSERQLVYYRTDTAASRLTAESWPERFEIEPGWVHVTGLTAALGDGPRALVERALAWARDAGITTSIDPNHRPTLCSAEQARATFRELAPLVDVALLSEEDAQALLGTSDGEQACAELHALGIELAVVKCGERGAVLGDRGSYTAIAPVEAHAVDSVGAGDGFDAGFIAGLRASGSPEHACRLGAFVGARAVEAVGEHCYPRRAELPCTLELEPSA